MTDGCGWLMIDDTLWIGVLLMTVNGRVLGFALFGGGKTTLICLVELASFDSVRRLDLVGDS